MPDWWIGRKHSDETKRKMSLARRGKNNNFFGRTHDDETRARMSAAKQGRYSGADNPNFGKQRPPEVKEAISKARVKNGVAAGSRNPNWKGGISTGRKAVMQTTRYKKWRARVFERDDYTCQMCPQRGGDLEADHIKPWAFYPKLRFRLSNGRTLCRRCHRTTFKDACRLRDAHKRPFAIKKP